MHNWSQRDFSADARGPYGGEPVHDAERQCVVIDSEVLFRRGREVVIRHRGNLYRLRITRNGKLILNK